MDGRAHGALVAPARRRIGVLWRAAPGSERPPEDRGLGMLFDAFRALGADVVPLPFGEERVASIRKELDTLDGVLAWVNPIQDGATRQPVDDLLREAAARGLFVSAHPDVVMTMGTKRVLFDTRHLGWGSDTAVYRSVDEMAEGLPGRLERHGRLVVKQGRGNGGNGVWSVELAGSASPVTLASPVIVREARAKAPRAERLGLGELVERCGRTLPWSGVVVDQEYQPRLADGLVRCYFSHDEVVGFCHQWPTGLLDPEVARSRPERRASVMEGATAPAYGALRHLAEHEWVPGMQQALGLRAPELPVVWDADFLYGPRNDRGEDTYVLCEINVSAVWPFPPTASGTIAANCLARIEGTCGARVGTRGPRAPGLRRE